ncbi:hypothetical protein BDZ97DRAFT_1843516 [Flammula alnicola]|nr:hypothetical protein BDZ97DRAFT_1843516 [Flammula alnicola]
MTRPTLPCTQLQDNSVQKLPWTRSRRTVDKRREFSAGAKSQCANSSRSVLWQQHHERFQYFMIPRVSCNNLRKYWIRTDLRTVKFRHWRTSINACHFLGGTKLRSSGIQVSYGSQYVSEPAPEPKGNIRGLHAPLCDTHQAVFILRSQWGLETVEAW